MPRFNKYNKNNYQNNYNPIELNTTKPRHEKYKEFNKKPQSRG